MSAPASIGLKHGARSRHLTYSKVQWQRCAQRESAKDAVKLYISGISLNAREGKSKNLCVGHLAQSCSLSEAPLSPHLCLLKPLLLL